MPDDAFEVAVETAADTVGEPVPLRFHLRRSCIEVAEILDRWPGADHTYVKLRGADGATYILRQDQGRGLWQMVLFRRKARLSSSGP